MTYGEFQPFLTKATKLEKIHAYKVIVFLFELLKTDALPFYTMELDSSEQLKNFLKIKNYCSLILIRSVINIFRKLRLNIFEMMNKKRELEEKGVKMIDQFNVEDIENIENIELKVVNELLNLPSTITNLMETWKERETHSYLLKKPSGEEVNSEEWKGFFKSCIKVSFNFYCNSKEIINQEIIDDDVIGDKEIEFCYLYGLCSNIYELRGIPNDKTKKIFYTIKSKSLDPLSEFYLKPDSDSFGKQVSLALTKKQKRQKLFKILGVHQTIIDLIKYVKDDSDLLDSYFNLLKAFCDENDDNKILLMENQDFIFNILLDSNFSDRINFCIEGNPKIHSIDEKVVLFLMRAYLIKKKRSDRLRDTKYLTIIKNIIMSNGQYVERNQDLMLKYLLSETKIRDAFKLGVRPPIKKLKTNEIINFFSALRRIGKRIESREKNSLQVVNMHDPNQLISPGSIIFGEDDEFQTFDDQTWGKLFQLFSLCAKGGDHKSETILQCQKLMPFEVAFDTIQFYIDKYDNPGEETVLILMEFIVEVYINSINSQILFFSKRLLELIDSTQMPVSQEIYSRLVSVLETEKGLYKKFYFEKHGRELPEVETKQGFLQNVPIRVNFLETEYVSQVDKFVNQIAKNIAEIFSTNSAAFQNIMSTLINVGNTKNDLKMQYLSVALLKEIALKEIDINVSTVGMLAIELLPSPDDSIVNAALGLLISLAKKGEKKKKKKEKKEESSEENLQAPPRQKNLIELILKDKPQFFKYIHSCLRRVVGKKISSFISTSITK